MQKFSTRNEEWIESETVTMDGSKSTNYLLRVFIANNITV